MSASQKISPLCRARVDAWLDSDLEENWKTMLLDWLKNDPEQIEDAFGKNLTFGTAGIRRKLGPGPNRMNRYTFLAITKALIQHLSETNQGKLRIVIGYDTREHSRYFAEVVANTIIKSEHIPLMFSEAVPTPLLAFATKHNRCTAGVMITASHNPTNYSGYKIYTPEGNQICSPVDEEICKLIEQLPEANASNEHTSTSSQKIEFIDDVANAYLSQMKQLPIFHCTKKSVPIAYTSMDGAGFPLVPKALAYWGFSPILKETQKNILYRENSNPESIEALQSGIAFMHKQNCAILLTNDPDADRVGLVSKELNEKSHHFSGNEIALLVLDYLGRCLGAKSAGMCIAKSWVTTPMIDLLAESFGMNLYSVPTGFKYIAKVIEQLEIEKKKHLFLMGMEESSGILVGTEPREKDGVLACCLLGCVAEEAWQKGITLYQQLLDLKRRIGFHFDTTMALSIPDNADKKKILETMREKLTECDGLSFQFQKRKYPEKDSLPTMQWKIGERGRCIVRASGTEQKIKCYLSLKDVLEKEESFLALAKELKSRIQYLANQRYV